MCAARNSGSQKHIYKQRLICIILKNEQKNGSWHWALMRRRLLASHCLWQSKARMHTFLSLNKRCESISAGKALWHWVKTFPTPKGTTCLAVTSEQSGISCGILKAFSYKTQTHIHPAASLGIDLRACAAGAHIGNQSLPIGQQFNKTTPGGARNENRRRTTCVGRRADTRKLESLCVPLFGVFVKQAAPLLCRRSEWVGPRGAQVSSFCLI
jgi:hypothetical protein